MSLHLPKATVWRGIYSGRVIVLLFFEGDYGSTVTVHGVRFRAMILASELDNNAIHDYCFQQDDARCHTAGETMDLLNVIFLGRLISKQGDFDGLPRSPDLTLTYFDKPESLAQIKANICNEISGIESA